MGKVARRHHFVPRSYLAGFTQDGERDGLLFVHDLVKRDVRQDKPVNVGFEHDFNRIEVAGHAPDVLEHALGELENRAISVIRGIQASGELPVGKEFSSVINLMALLVVRNPRFRENRNKARRQMFRVMYDWLVSDKRLFEHHLTQAKANGFVPQDNEVSFEAVKQFIRDGRYTITVSTGENLAQEFGGFDHALQRLGTRYWLLVTAAVDAPDFVTCDHPVVPIFKDPHRRGLCGYGLPETEVTFPLNPRQALLGVFENPLAERIEADAESDSRRSALSSTLSIYRNLRHN